MRGLETKIPPPLLTLGTGAGMGFLATVGPRLWLPPTLRWSLAAGCVLLGIGLSGAGVVAMRRARTTLSPLTPDAASSLVTTGIYAVTRNPMYLGLVLALVGWAIYLRSPLALLGPAAFGLYIDRFQIRPEERALAARFGSRFADYTARVRRWL